MKLLPKSQFGYRKGKNISDLHISIQKTIYQSLNDKNVKSIDVIFLDLSDASDTVCHERLLKKLEL